MKLHEYIANKLFSDYNVPMIRGYVVSSPDEIKDFEKPVVLKIQILSGGRGKAGGVKKAGDIIEAKKIASELIDSKIKDHKVEKLFIVPAVDYDKEYYLGYTIDRQDKNTVLLVSASGGIDVEQAAKNDEMIRIPIDPVDGFDANRVLETLVEKVDEAKEITSIAEKLYGLFTEYDATTCEINPLVRTAARLLG